MHVDGCYTEVIQRHPVCGWCERCVKLCTSSLSSTPPTCLILSLFSPSLSYFSSLVFFFAFHSSSSSSPRSLLPVSLLRDKAPGQRECDSSIDNINKCIRDIEQASLAAVSQNLASRDDISLEVSNRRIITRHCPHATAVISFSCSHSSLFVCPRLVVSLYPSFFAFIFYGQIVSFFLVLRLVSLW